MASNNTKPPQYLSMEDQQLYLESLINVVKSHAFQMKVSLDKNKIMDGLKSASGMISELRTTLLSPKNYYELYMKVTDELQHLQIFLVEELRKGMNDSNLYEVVQYAGNIVPRLYLLVTVGLAYVKNNISLRREILKDLVEMCRGVQHPLKGLFLRSYLLQCSRNILPDVPIAEKENEGTVYDSIDFVLVNFGEMNKLWVRMQHQGHSRDKDRLENERKELRILVGTNLVRLSQLESITVEIYSKIVLPGILEQVVSCRDAIAQDYLMECIIQVFPDEFHLKTLSIYLKTVAELKQGVNIKNIIICLMNRLATYNQRQMKINKTKVTTDSVSVLSTKTVPSVQKENGLNSNGDVTEVLEAADSFVEDQQANGDIKSTGVISDSVSGQNDFEATNDLVDEADKVELFEIFSDHIAHIVQIRKMSTDEIIALKVALMNLAQKSYPDRIDYIDMVMLATINVLDQLNIEELVSNKPISRELTKLMKLPIDHYNDILKIVELQHFSKLLKYFDKTGQKNLGIYLITNALEHQTFIRKKDQVVKIFDMLESLTNVQIEIDETNNSYDQETLIDEQLLLARFLYFLRSDDFDEQFDILTICQNCLKSSNVADSLRYTIPPIVFAYYELALQYKQNELKHDNWNQKCHSIFKNCHSIVNSLMKYDLFELPLRLFLQGALTISKIKFDDYESLAYEFVSQAFSIYEDEISESKAQLSAISLIVGTLEQLECFGEENAEPLRTQCSLAGAKLLKKPDQCRAAIVCSHLFWSSKNYTKEIRDEKRVTERLIKAYNIAKQCLNNLVQVQLFTEILNHYIYFFERGCEKITVDMINELIIKLKSITENLDNSEESEQILKHFANTIDHVRSQIETNEDLTIDNGN